MGVEAYIAKRGEFENVRNRLKAVAGTMASVASALQSQPTKFIFSNQPIGLPPEATMGRDCVSITADSWPSVEQIMRLLEEYHRTREGLLVAWGSLARSEQDSMKSPDDLLPRR